MHVCEVITHYMEKSMPILRHVMFGCKFWEGEFDVHYQ